MLTEFTFLSYYRKYKALMEKLNKWHLACPQLLAELATAFSPNQVHYAEALVEEHELDKLLTLAKQKSEMLIVFGNILYPAYSDEVNKLYFKMVTSTDIGKNRKSYQKIANMILNCAKYGDRSLAQDWCQVLVDDYSDRSAFIDEIQRNYD